MSSAWLASVVLILTWGFVILTLFSTIEKIMRKNKRRFQTVSMSHFWSPDVLLIMMLSVMFSMYSMLPQQFTLTKSMLLSLSMKLDTHNGLEGTFVDHKCLKIAWKTRFRLWNKQINVLLLFGTIRLWNFEITRPHTSFFGDIFFCLL